MSISTSGLLQKSLRASGRSWLRKADTLPARANSSQPSSSCGGGQRARKAQRQRTEHAPCLPRAQARWPGRRRRAAPRRPPRWCRRSERARRARPAPAAARAAERTPRRGRRSKRPPAGARSGKTRTPPCCPTRHATRTGTAPNGAGSVRDSLQPLTYRVADAASSARRQSRSAPCSVRRSARCTRQRATALAATQGRRPTDVAASRGGPGAGA